MNQQPETSRARAARPGLTDVLRRRLRLRRAFEQGRAEVDYPPVSLWLESTNRCNLRCPMCPQSDGLKRAPGFMPLELLDRIAEQARGRVQSVSLHFAGEPLLNENIAGLIRAFSSRGVPTIMHTNGTLLTPERSRELILSGLDQMAISFDAVPPEGYAKKRTPARFDATLERIRGLLEEKKRLRSAWPIVTLKALVFSDEKVAPESMREYRALFSGLPVDNFAMERAHTFGGAFAENVLRTGRYVAPPRDEPTGCVLPWYGFSIGWDGTAYACCNDLNGECRLGHAGEQSLDEIWNGAPMRELRSALAARDPERLPLCRNCDAFHHRFESKHIISEGLKFAAKHVIRPMVYRRGRAESDK